MTPDTRKSPPPPAPLMVSVAGIRGVIGESLTPDVVTRYAAAFAREAPEGAVVVGRDARPTGPLVLAAVRAGLMGAGRDVIDLGLATTPTVEVAVEHLGAAGGVIITASHNPTPWNALKFLSPRGEFLDAAAGARVRERFESSDALWAPWDGIGHERAEPHALEWHLSRVLHLPYLDREAIARRGLVAVVDGCASVGGPAVPRLLEQLGVRVVRLDCEPDGRFTRELEPLPEHLGALARAVREARADFGVALDPDADRAALVDADGIALGEEYTLALAAQIVLARTPGPVVTNLSTSLIMDAVCARAGVPLYRTPVGEAHVVAEMRTRGAVIGGEGNGGVILPAAHHGRDGLVAVALVTQALAGGGTLRGLADALPRFAMIKRKFARGGEPWNDTAARLRERFARYAVSEVDGLRFDRDGEWVHVRPSGTEPMVRIIAESPSEDRTLKLIDEAHAVLTARSQGAASSGGEG
jgi:phosphomannomutase